MSRTQLAAGDVKALVDRFDSLQAECRVRSGRDYPVVVIQEAGSTPSLFTARWKAKVLRATSSILRRSQRPVVVVEQRLTRSIGKRCSGRCLPINEVNRGFALWSGRRRWKKKIAARFVGSGVTVRRDPPCLAGE